jgi:hypothetical protein
VEEKVNKRVYSPEYKKEFIGRDSPAPTKYDPHVLPLTTFFSVKKEDYRTIPREARICPIVSKYQLSLTNVSPHKYLDNNSQSLFRLNKKNSPHFGSRAARNLDVRLYG